MENRINTPGQISGERNLNHGNVEYMLKLADVHGIDILRRKHEIYSAEFKEIAIKLVFLGKESAFQVSLNLGLSNQGILPRWIKEYTENGYTVVEKKRGYYAKESTEDTGRIRKRTRGITREELETYNRERILKKIRCLGYEKRKIKKKKSRWMRTEDLSLTIC